MITKQTLTISACVLMILGWICGFANQDIIGLIFFIESIIISSVVMFKKEKNENNK